MINLAAHGTTVLLLVQCIPRVVADSSNSVAGVSDIQSFIASITKAVIVIAGSMAVLMFTIGGFRYVTSSGNPVQLQRAKHTLLYAAIGLAIAIGSLVLGSIVTALASNAFGS